MSVIPHELTLFEYDTCSAPDQLAALFDCRERLQPYLAARWLTRSFDGDHTCIKASHYVGLLPFSDEDGPHLLLIAPKGSQYEPRLGLLRFLELLAIAEGETPPEDVLGWEGELGPHPFLLFLAGHYAHLLHQLCHRDFRSYYRAEEGELRSRIRGRLQLADYARKAVRGRPHVLPCHWEEFTVDNWDNRILWAAAHRLQGVAAGLDPQAATSVRRPFERLRPWFSSVAEVAISAADLGRSRLEKTSQFYRHALAWARLILRGSNLPSAGGQVPPLILDTNSAFERFAEAVARAALPDVMWHASFQYPQPFLQGQQNQARIPDILLSRLQRPYAVGDAKYKDVLDRSMNARLESGQEVVRVCIQPADWNQLYVYMRITGASHGFFVVPFWSPNGEMFEWLDTFTFEVPPCEGGIRVGVLAINLLQRNRRLKDVKEAAASCLRRWLSAPT